MQDRITVQAWDLQIEDGQMKISSSTDVPQSDPVVEDSSLPGSYWKIFVSDGQIGIEVTTNIPQNDFIVEDSTCPGIYWKIFVSDGQIVISITIYLIRRLKTATEQTRLLNSNIIDS